MKKKPWKIVLIFLVAITVVLGLLWLSPRIYYVAQNKYGDKLVQTTKKIASVELVSQERPLVFFEQMEKPPIEGLKVKINYEDSSSEVVDAYEMNTRKFQTSYNPSSLHYKGMFFATNTFSPFRTSEFLLEPGLHSIVMYYIDYSYDLDYDGEWEFAHNPEEIDVGSSVNFGYCMVDVYVQTAEEYIAERKPPLARVTESNEGRLSLKKDESGLIQFLAKESGKYLLQIEGEYRLNVRDYTRSGALFFEEGNFCAQLNANEPIYIGVRALDESSASLDISLTRVPDNEVIAQ